MSKQAMNQLLKSLEGYGYLERSAAPEDARARTIRSTRRGRAAYKKIHEILRDVERDYSAELGLEDLSRLKQLLYRIWTSPLATK